jgi:hypothetical protein
MTVRAISTTDRRSIHPAWESISVGAQPASLRRALALLAGCRLFTNRS